MLVESDGSRHNVVWSSLVVGDVIQVSSDELLPADVVVLGASAMGNAVDVCFVSTVGLDGETSAKVLFQKFLFLFQFFWQIKRVPVSVSLETGFFGVLQCESPNKDLSRFVGTLECGGRKVALNNENVFYRGSRLVQTEAIVGVVVFTGQETKIMQVI
jgi:magnesium-transporting ATPase (P-type)